MKKKILFEVIISNQCNKRCFYCDLQFNNNIISDENIHLICKFIKENSSEVEYFHINFFGGEPLLEFDKIKLFILLLKDIKNIKYSIGTNGLLLDEDKSYFLNKYDFIVYYSIDYSSNEKIFNNLEKLNKDKTYINFIISPNDFNINKKKFNKIIKSGFYNINIMPIYGNIGLRNNYNLKELKIFLDYINLNKNNYNFNYFNYFNGFPSDYQYIFDINGNLYQDLDSIIWLQKQYKNVGNIFKSILEKKTFISSIKNLKLENIFNNYDKNLLKKLIYLIAYKQNLIKTYKKIEYIINISKRG